MVTASTKLRLLLLGRKAMTKLDNILKSRDITLPTKVHIVTAMVFPVVMYGCESWAIKRVEWWRIDAFECGAGEGSWEFLGQQGDQPVHSNGKSTLNTHWKDWCWSWSSNTLATWCEEWLIGKDPDGEEDWGHGEKEKREDEMVGWHHQLNGHEFEQTLGDVEGQGGLICCSSWGHKELNLATGLATEQQLPHLSGM